MGLCLALQGDTSGWTMPDVSPCISLSHTRYFPLPLSLMFPHRRAVSPLLGIDPATDVPCGQREERAVDAVK